MLAPRSYTREDVVELQCHGNDLCLRRVLRACLEAGARLADPGQLLLILSPIEWPLRIVPRLWDRQIIYVHYGFLVSGIKCYALICQICILFLGEFTLRAFLNGRLDLAQAENVSRLISAKSAAAADSALAGIQVISSWAYIDAPVQR